MTWTPFWRTTAWPARTSAGGFCTRAVPRFSRQQAAALGLSKEEMDASWECLRKVGNLSSASVLLVLEEVFKRRRPEAGTYSVLAAMGPGFCSELVLLRWN